MSSVQRRAKRVAFSVALILVPLLLVFLMRDGLVARLLEAPPASEHEQSPDDGSRKSLVAPDKSAWSSVSIKESPADKAEDKPAAVVATPANAASSAQVTPVPAPKDRIFIPQPTQPIRIGK